MARVLGSEAWGIRTDEEVLRDLTLADYLDDAARPLTGKLLLRAFTAAVHGTDRQFAAFMQLCALEGI